MKSVDENITLARGVRKKVSHKKIFVPGGFFFRNAAALREDKEIHEALAVVLALTGNAGATGALYQGGAEISAELFEFQVDQEHLIGWLGSLPFEDGDEVVAVVSAEAIDGFKTCFAVARPSDRLIAVHPFCSRSPRACLARMVKRTLVFSFLVALVTAAATTDTRPGWVWPLAASAGFAVLWVFVEWRAYLENYKPLAHLTAAIATSLGIQNPFDLDLVKVSKKSRIGNEPPGYRWTFFRY